MDTLTHCLLGGVAIRAAFPAEGSRVSLSNRQRLTVGALAAAFPDIDYLASWVDPMVYLTRWHRGVTHSLILMPLWAIVVGVLLALLFRRRAHWRYFSLLAGTAVLTHIFSDLITVYGTQILAPLSSWRASFGITFIIDPWFTAIVLAGFVLGLRDRPWLPPSLFLGALVAYLALESAMKLQSLTVAEDHIQRHGLLEAHATALPQPFSPFNWKLVVGWDDHYDVAYINLAGGYSVGVDETGFWAEARRTYRVADRPAWQTFSRYGVEPGTVDLARRLWQNHQLDYFRQFAAFPILYRVDHASDHECVWFTDLRYVLPFMTPPFRYGLCRTNRQTDWHLYRLTMQGTPQRL